jgi:thioredoxin 1
MFDKLLQSIGLKSKAPAQTAAVVSPPQPAAIDVTDADFATIILASERLAVVDCWAEWCEPCQVMSAYVHFLAADYADRLLVTALDVEANPATTAQYEIMGLPTLLFFRNGQEIARQVGVVPYETLCRQVEELLAQG